MSTTSSSGYYIHRKQFRLKHLPVKGFSSETFRRNDFHRKYKSSDFQRSGDSSSHLSVIPIKFVFYNADPSHSGTANNGFNQGREVVETINGN